MSELTELPILSEKINDLANQVLVESDTEKTKDLIALFNWNLSKKNVVRVLKLNNLFDAVTEQMSKRFSAKPDQFSKDDLLNYMKTVQSAIDNSHKVLDNIEEPPRIINNTQINVNVIDSFNRESRARILQAVQATLKDVNKLPNNDIIIEEGEESSDE